MTSQDANPTTFGNRLRDWRNARRISQLKLAAEAGVSQRHISFLETGRAKPSREMVIHLATALDVPMRQRNELLERAGFAPAYRERSPDDSALRQITAVLTRLLQAHEPYPAYIVDRLWNLVAANTVATKVLAGALPPGSDPETFGGNIMRLILHPEGVRESVVNWDDVSAVLLDRLAHEVAANPADAELDALLVEARGYLDAESTTVAPPRAEDLLVPVVLATPHGALELFTTIATIGGAHDITLQELRIETLLPATDEAERLLRSIAAT